jgi:hypothetical protein
VKLILKNSRNICNTFGAVLSQIGDSNRQSFIGKPTCGVEKDYESSLGDFGVRKPRQVGMQAYDDFTGRFFQIDPNVVVLSGDPDGLSAGERYYGWTPYHF